MSDGKHKLGPKRILTKLLRTNIDLRPQFLQGCSAKALSYHCSEHIRTYHSLNVSIISTDEPENFKVILATRSEAFELGVVRG